MLGNIVESSKLSINRSLYGNVHGHAHRLISYVHDPDGKYLEEFSAVGAVETAMRDPVFYRLHVFADNFGMRYKALLPEYPSNQLSYDKIEVKSVGLQITRPGVRTNVLLTYWQKSLIDLGVGVDFGNEGSFFGSFKHLQYAPFIYSIAVVNSDRRNKMGTCRIFIAPKFNEKGRPLKFDEQRVLFIEMDKFTVTCRIMFDFDLT